MILFRDLEFDIAEASFPLSPLSLFTKRNTPALPPVYFHVLAHVRARTLFLPGAEINWNKVRLNKSQRDFPHHSPSPSLLP